MKTNRMIGGDRMGKKYGQKERQEALKLADGIGAAAVGVGRGKAAAKRSRRSLEQQMDGTASRVALR